MNTVYATIFCHPFFFIVASVATHFGLTGHQHLSCQLPIQFITKILKYNLKIIMTKLKKIRAQEQRILRKTKNNGSAVCSIIFVKLYVYHLRHLHLQHRQHTSHEEETSNNRRKTKSLHCPQLDHHDADGLAGHKTWRTAQTTTMIFTF
jgi:hypothetical protein